MTVRAFKPGVIRTFYILLALLALPFFIWNGFIQQLSTQWNDLLLRLNGTQSSSAVRQIVLVAIDDHTAARYGPLPLNRATLAEGLEALAQGRPRVLVLDLLISEPDDRLADERLNRALRKFPRVVLGAALESDAGQRPDWILPLPLLASGHSIGHVHAAPDSDGAVRAVLLLKEGTGHRFWALGLEAARLAISADRPLETGDSVVLGPIRIPAAERDARAVLIHYAGPEGTLPRVSFSAFLEGTADASIVRDKVVILGATAQGSGDRLFTPLSSGIGMSGIEIHANVVRTILDEAFLRPVGLFGELAGSLLILSLSLLAVVRLRGPRLFLTLLTFGFLILAAAFGSLRVGYVFPIGSFLAVFLLTSAVAGVGEYALVSRALAGETVRRKEYAFRVQAIAHELKTPLTAIQGSSEMISEGLLPEHQRTEIAGLIHKESKRLTTLVQTFLNVERLASGALRLEKQEVDLCALCSEIIERGRLYASRKRIQVTASIPEIQVLADPDLLSFAIFNLITNGVKYSPKNTTVLVKAEEDGAWVSISVADQGYGIAPADQEKIFEKFYRLKRDEKGAEEGTGIGLALVKEIVQQHGGRVSVESTPSAGSRFTITVPKG